MAFPNELLHKRAGGRRDASHNGGTQIAAVVTGRISLISYKISRSLGGGMLEDRKCHAHGSRPLLHKKTARRESGLLSTVFYFLWMWKGG